MIRLFLDNILPLPFIYILNIESILHVLHQKKKNIGIVEYFHAPKSMQYLFISYHSQG